MADLVAFLASDAASYMTGEIVVIDGGRMTLNCTVDAEVALLHKVAGQQATGARTGLA